VRMMAKPIVALIRVRCGWGKNTHRAEDKPAWAQV